MKKKVPVISSKDLQLKIVLIEDDEIIRNGYAFLLGNDPDFRITGTYESFEEASKYLPLQNPDIILIDVQLPGIRGVDAIPVLKKMIPDVQVIVLTVYESAEVIFTALKNGASGYMTKNISHEKIIEGIKEVVSGGGAMSPGIAKLVMQAFRQNPDTPLTKRETEILRAVADGKSRGKIASALFIDLETVKSHIRNIYHKLNVNSRDQAIKVARESRYI